MNRMMIFIVLALTTATVETNTFAANEQSKGTPFKVASDSRARYFLLGVVPGKRGNIIATTRREGPSGITFARREINCSAQTYRYLGEGDNVKQTYRPNYSVGEMSDLDDGSISDVVVKFACSKR